MDQEYQFRGRGCRNGKVESVPKSKGAHPDRLSGKTDNTNEQISKEVHEDLGEIEAQLRVNRQQQEVGPRHFCLTVVTRRRVLLPRRRCTRRRGGCG